ncbi:tellurium resistance protein TerC [Rhodopirellula sp.]|nr:TerC family protein [Rhodopirellula sp.]MDB4679272.1 tellurium resistance protein TerC [Rhodopirellula sp.]
MLELSEILLNVTNAMPLAEAVTDGAADATQVVGEKLFSLNSVFTLGMLIVLQAVLGFDNLLYISIESKRVPEEQQSMVRKAGISLAIIFRIGLLFVLVNLVEKLQGTFFTMDTKPLSFSLSGHSLIVIGGGAFILWTAVKEIYHLLAVHNLETDPSKTKRSTLAKSVTMIVIMNIVFSFDSILSAMALTKLFIIMATAIIISGLLMIWLADHVAVFLQKNRMYEVLGLFILFIVGIMLVSEGGHLAEIELFGTHVNAMSKSTFYFVLSVLILVDVVQSRYQKKLLAEQERQAQAASPVSS